jgi:hypothetical protein
MVNLVMKLHHQMGVIFQGTTDFKPSGSKPPPFTPTVYHFRKCLFTSSLFESYTSQPLFLPLSKSRIFKLLTACPSKVITCPRRKMECDSHNYYWNLILNLQQ